MSTDDDVLLERTEDLRHAIAEDEDMGTVSNASVMLRSTRDDEDTVHMSTEDGGETETRSVVLAAGGDAGGGFVVGGSVNRSQHVHTYDLDDEDEDRHTVVLSGDEDEDDGMDGDEERGLLGDDEVAVVTIRPLSKSRLLPARPAEELDQSTQIVGQERSEVNIEERTGYVKVW